MYLKEVILDGFKSYAQRTTVSAFDPSFNAITGLNGSGKSNVLDSICFVLGITNLSQVRASSLQELVYKGGQAGVSKATVNLIFDNRDKARAPVGYEDGDEITVTRQIVIGGRNKYLINGVNAQPGRVQNLFHSVGLNVNNPHFLIMQGRITKVINMKPAEVLGMIEEAAGTRMYEGRKNAALKTIEKKKRKVTEINSVLEEKINPELAKLEKERGYYLDWNANQNRLEILRRYCVAWEYTQMLELMNKSEGIQLEQRLLSLERDLSSFTTTHKEATVTLSALKKEREKQLDDGSLEEKQNNVDDIAKKIVKMKTLWANQKEALQRETQAVEKVQTTIKDNNISLDQLRKAMEDAHERLQPAEAKLKDAEKAVEDAETALMTGASSQGSQSGAGSAVDQLETARRTVSDKQTEMESLKLEKTHVEGDLNEKASQIAKDRENVRALQAQRQKAEQAISDAKLAVHELDFDTQAADELNQQFDNERRVVRELEDKADHLSAKLTSCDFQYRDPHPNFDRRKVHGLIAKLIRVKDPSVTTAIETAAGGRLYQVVVDDDATAGAILKHGRLARRVTMLPLNKIRHEILSRKKLEAARRIEPRAELALNLVQFDPHVTNAMKHVFGRTIVCPDSDSAMKVCFDPNVRTRTVTLEGDTFDPSGTASGGSSSRQGPSLLTQIGQLNEVVAELRHHQDRCEKLDAQVRAIHERGRRYRQLQATLEMRQNEATLLEQRLDETSTGRLLAEVEALKKRYKEIGELLHAGKETLRNEMKQVKELENILKDSEASKERAAKEARAALQKVRAARKKADIDLQAVKDEHSRLTIDMETTEEEVKRLEKQVSTVLQPSLMKLAEEVEMVESKLAKTSENYDSAEKDLAEYRERIASSSKALQRARKEVEDLGEKIETLNLEKSRVESKLRDIEKGKAGAEKAVEKLEKKHPWIEQEREKFGVEGGEYELSREKVRSSREELGSLEATQETLSRKINKKAMHLFETTKEEYRNLMEKKRKTEQDRLKIEQTIMALDKEKLVAVEKTWRKVNVDFGNIFSDLLPGTSAKLEPPEGQTVEDGLEIRVAFGDVWKDSLSELSGGQRSLIALSLILAMLRFKPAPMYILDEVDAALDLSHTQNIGRMLRRHFGGSQFIVVSLKEGMFGNANVIFRTKFVDGVSTIQRTANKPVDDETNGMSRVNEADKENVQNLSTRVGRKRRAVA